jgi:hypothetical protein
MAEERYLRCNPGIDWDGTFTENDRRVLETKLMRLMSWIGARVPEMVVLNGKEVPLGDVLWDLLRKKECFSDDEKKAIFDLEVALEKKFKEDLRTIRTETLNEDEAVGSYCEALGLIRAIVSLKGLMTADTCGGDSREVSKKIADRRKDDANSWLNFLKRVNPE